MNVLGITHPIAENTAAALLVDGKIIAVGEEERFLRIKHASRVIPENSINHVLKQAQIQPSDIDYIGIGWDGPKTEQDVIGYIRKGLLSGWITSNEKKYWFLSLEQEKSLGKYLKQTFPNAKIFHVKHHIAHAASACFVSGMRKTMFLTADGRGENESGILGIFNDGEFEIIRSLELDESLGSFYGNFTLMNGFREHSEEGKTMGLAPYGNPIKTMLNILETKKNSKIIIDWNRLFTMVKETRFQKDDPTSDQRKDLAATAQYLLEQSIIQLVTDLKESCGLSSICLAGGTALNIDANGKLLSSGLIKEIFVQPAAHDAGTALGAALIVHNEYSSIRPQKMEHAYFGPNFDDEFENTLKNQKIEYERRDDISEYIAELLSNNKIISWFQGNAEFGPRALGNRSILANPTDKTMWKRVNEVKGRESWRPLAPSILEEKTDRYFKNHDTVSPFMLLSFEVKDEKINEIPAVVHVDNSARPQTVSKKTNQKYWNLIKKFEKINNVPVILNTSFNLRGEPMVNTPTDAISSFNRSNLDYLCMGNFIIKK